jgi:O-antigen ligase
LFPSLKRFLAKFHVYGSWGLDLCFTLLCLRFIGASFYEAQGYFGPTLILVGVCFGLACSRPQAALFIFTLAAPWLSGLSQTQLLASASPLFLGFSALWLGNLTRRGVAEKNQKIMAARAALKSTTHWLILAVDLLSAALLVSAIATLWPQRHEPNLWSTLSKSSGLGFGDRYYALHSAFLWLQGLFFFKLLLTSVKNDRVEGDEAGDSLNSPTIEPTPEHRPATNESPIAQWIAPVIMAYVIPLLGFSALQHFLKIPDSMLGAFLLSPYEDIHSLGGIAVTIWASVLALVATRRKWLWAVQLVGFGAMSTLLMMTYSRATWLAAAIGVFLLVSLRLKFRWMVLVVLASVALWWTANDSIKKGGTWANNQLMDRLHSLIRVENLSTKSSARFEIYHKALGMIQSRPWTGHGSGSFYLTSPKFAPKNATFRGPIPNFAHNFILQFAAELGIPATLLFCSLIGAAWCKGFRYTRAALKEKNGDRVPLALFLALTSYLITQMTANSLNIYVSHQFLFWFLIAALLGMTREGDRKLRVAG